MPSVNYQKGWKWLFAFFYTEIILVDVYLHKKFFYFTKNAALYTSTFSEDIYDKFSVDCFKMLTFIQ